MPDRYTNQNITSVANMLGEYLNVALKRQNQFSAPLVRAYGEEGDITLQRAREGLVIKEPEKEPDYESEIEDTFNAIFPFLSKERKVIYRDTYEGFIEGGVDKSEATAFNKISGKIPISTGAKKAKEIDIEKLQNAKITYENKISTIKLESGGEIGFEPAKKAVEKRFMGKDKTIKERIAGAFAKDIPAEKGFYWVMEGGEKVPITKEEYEEKLIAKNKEERHIPVYEDRIKEIDKKLGVTEPKSREDLDPLGIR